MALTLDSDRLQSAPLTRLLGVLGGMGPLATLDFCNKLIVETAALHDQGHLPLLIHNVPQIPDRTEAILARGPSPLPALLDGVARLVSAGCTHLVMPCNTAHAWYDALASHSPVPFIHIVDAVLDGVDGDNLNGSFGLLATAGTIEARVFQKRFAELGACLLLPDDGIQEAIQRGIASVKAGRVAEGGTIFAEQARHLLARGATSVILGCTEIPVGIDAAAPELSSDLVDATQMLARACVKALTAKPFDQRRANTPQTLPHIMGTV